MSSTDGIGLQYFANVDSNVINGRRRTKMIDVYCHLGRVIAWVWLTCVKNYVVLTDQRESDCFGWVDLCEELRGTDQGESALVGLTCVKTYVVLTRG